MVAHYIFDMVFVWHRGFHSSCCWPTYSQHDIKSSERAETMMLVRPEGRMVSDGRTLLWVGPEPTTAPPLLPRFIATVLMFIFLR